MPTFFSSSDSLLSEVDVDDDDEERRLKENKQNLLISSLVTRAISSEKFLMTEKINRKEKYLTCFSKVVLPFLRGLYLEGLIFKGAYVRREICVSKSIGLTFFLEGNLPFFFVLLCIWGQFSSTSPMGGLYLEGRFNGGFFALRVWGTCIWRSLSMEGLTYVRNFTVLTITWIKTVMMMVVTKYVFALLLLSTKKFKTCRETKNLLSFHVMQCIL